jgi:hypothetical protein
MHDDAIYQEVERPTPSDRRAPAAPRHRRRPGECRGGARGPAPNAPEPRRTGTRSPPAPARRVVSARRVDGEPDRSRGSYTLAGRSLPRTARPGAQRLGVTGAVAGPRRTQPRPKSARPRHTLPARGGGGPRRPTHPDCARARRPAVQGAAPARDRPPRTPDRPGGHAAGIPRSVRGWSASPARGGGRSRDARCVRSRDTRASAARVGTVPARRGFRWR